MTNATDRNGDPDYVHDFETDETPSEAVYTVVAAVSNCPPTDLDPLADHVNPDALDALFGWRAGSAGVSVRFDCCGYEITVTSDAISLRERDPDCD